MSEQQNQPSGSPVAGEAASRSVYDILDELRGLATSKSDKGARFEKLMKAFFRTDPIWADQFEDVWLWTEWPGNGGKHDTGIDLVAKPRVGDGLVAIQCKFYEPSTTISKDDIDTFLSASGKLGFTGRIVVSTTQKWSSHAEDTIRGQQIPVQRVGMPDLEASPIDWSKFSVDAPGKLALSTKKSPRAHQVEAIEGAIKGFTDHERGQLIMACGTGKTLTSLRLAEQLVGAGGSVLFLVPSISLLSQSLREWASQATVELAPLAVCSDPKVSRDVADVEDISTVDLALPATTNTEVLGERLSAAVADTNRMTVVFATYQSIAVVAKAQAAGQVAPFDLILCDEAHRTTGATLAGDEESAFVKVHDNSYVKASRRLYMTATPRIFDDSVKAKAGEANALLADMGDETTFGPEFYRLGFGEAVSRGLLTDYKVLVLAVGEGSVARTFQEQFKDTNNELQLNDYARIIGCWNGLAKRGITEHTFGDDVAPMRRAVAFAGSIADSKRIQEAFSSVVETYIEAHDLDGDDEGAGEGDGDRMLRTQVRHVDGGMNALERNAHLDWLKSPSEEDTCRILTNARCLSEGVDVPGLDAVMFLSPRKSVVDVVQSVGRVMRLAQGKRYGYIILPVGIPAGMEPEDALRDNDRYRVVWEVLQALRAHDDRFDAIVNKIDLNHKRDDKIDIIGVTDKLGDQDGSSSAEGAGSDGPAQGQLALEWPALADWRDAIYARIVKKVGNRRYWETWASDIAKIAQTHIIRIEALLDSDTSGVVEQFDQFLTGLRGNLNDSITRTDAVEMLAQHLITRPVFDALFEGYAFTDHNPVAQTMQGMLEALDEHQLDDENSSLEKFYESVRVRARGIDNAEGRQRIIVELYDTFFKTAFPRTVDKLGIVYTPIEVVDFILNSADWVLRQEFGQGITDKGVHVLDGFTGTGTFIVRLIQSGLITPHDLARKFTSELHANEFLLLAYYIAAINIETAFHDVMRAQQPDAPYVSFEGLVLADTFQMHEEGDAADLHIFPTNNARIDRQRALDIRVVIGNPPYSAGQDSANDNNANEKYPTLDAAIRDTYAALSTATNKNSLYDSYIRAIKWASLRVKDRGVVAFVTNGGWLDSNVADGIRKTLVTEFSSIYVFNLRGNQYTAGEDSKREGGKIFGAGSRASVAVFLLVKNPVRQGQGVVHYSDIGDYLSREEKLGRLREVGDIGRLETQIIIPNLAGDWLEQRSDDFSDFIPLGDKSDAGSIFEVYAPGLQSNRDAWVYNHSSKTLAASMSTAIQAYGEAIAGQRSNDLRRIKWSSSLEARLQRRELLTLDTASPNIGMYRPFEKTLVYADKRWIHRPGIAPRAFPTPKHGNVGIYCLNPGAEKPFSVLMTDVMPDVALYGSNAGQFFARYRYEKVETDGLFPQDNVAEVVKGYRRIDNITDTALERFSAAYGDHVTKDDVFFYCYGLLHSPDYRSRYAADLKKMLPRIPLVVDAQPFIDAGRKLAELHLNYESVEVNPLGGLEDLFSGEDDDQAYARYRVEKMRYGKPTAEQKKAGLRQDKSTVVYNAQITLTGIPEEAHRYMLGAKSALDWVIERYAVAVNKDSGIRNDPNDWSREVGNPRYILDLLARIVSVSVQTVRIIEALPALEPEAAP